MDEETDSLASDEAKARKRVEKNNRRFIYKVGVGLLLAFGLFCSIGYMVGYSGLAIHLVPEARLFIKDTFFAVGSACAVSLIFGFLLELPQTSDYIAEKLSDLMFGDEYLGRIRNSLPLFRRRIDRVLFGEAEVASQQSLYNFMEGRLQALYRASFRRNMNVEMRCTDEAGGMLLWRQKTSYTYVRNPQDGKESVIRSKRTLDVASPLLPATPAQTAAAFNGIVLRLYMRVGEHEYESSPSDRTVLTRVVKKDVPQERMPETVAVDYIFKLGKLTYSFVCALPMEMFVKTTDVLVNTTKEVFVELQDDHRTLREAGNLVYAGVNAPTEDLTLDCFFPDGTRLEPARFFWQGVQKMADLRTEFGAISVKIPGWLLQGEGGCVAWFLPQHGGGPSPTSAQDVRATPPDVSET